MPSGEDEFLVESQEEGTTRRRRQMVVGGVAVITTIALIVILVMVFAAPATAKKPKYNVIMMISDGWGPASATLTRSFSKKALNIDPYLAGTVRTFSADSLVTDSAAGATAYSCGKHTYNGGIGIDANKQACGTVLEAAARKGLRTGVVTTTRITDATPAAFIAHSADRGWEPFIARQALDVMGFEKHVDVMLGGGAVHFAPTSQPDNLDLVAFAKQKGYTVVSNAAELDAVESGKVLGLFAQKNMAYTLDRINNPAINASQPALVTMAKKALDLLKNENGFFVMLEGALIDVAEHSNDAASSVYEVLGYDETFQLALDFAKEHGNTVIISTSDHETGGLTLGMQTNYTPGAYPDYAYYPEMLAAFNASCDTMAARIAAGGNVAEVIAAATNITDITPEEEQLILTYMNNSLGYAIGKLISTRSLIGWTTHGHTGVDVNLYVYGLPEDIEIRANHENIDIATFIAQILDLDLEAITSEISGFNTTGIVPTDIPPKARRDPIHARH